jgi:Helix-turn-helix
MNTEVLLVEPSGQPSVTLSSLKASRLHAQSDVRAALARHHRDLSLWIAPNDSALELLLGSLPHRPGSRDLRLLVLERFGHQTRNLLHAYFRFVVSAKNGARVLPINELTEVLGSSDRADLLIGGEVIPGRSELLLYRGNLEPIAVPLKWFVSGPGSPEPDSSRFAVTDYGQSVRLGEYEASVDAILYEFDDDYRARAKKRAAEHERSLGGAIRRLRLQKGLRQSDFPGITAKEIARIERGLVKKPHNETLRKIAKKTGVPVERLHTY